jgi:hypothetical protein
MANKSDLLLVSVAATHSTLVSKETSMTSLVTRQRDLHILYPGIMLGKKLRYISLLHTKSFL